MKRKAAIVLTLISALGVLVFAVSAAAGSGAPMRAVTPRSHSSHAGYRSQSQGLTRSDLRALLGRQLGEHSALAMTATNLGVVGSPAFPAAAWPARTRPSPT